MSNETSTKQIRCRIWLTKEQQKEVCKFYQSGENIATIADKIKVSRTCVRNALIRHGIPRRTLPEIRKGGHLSETTKRRISSALKGKTVSKDTRRRMSEAQQGSKHYLYGKSLSEETVKRIADSLRGRFKGDKNPHWKVYYNKHEFSHLNDIIGRIF